MRESPFLAGGGLSHFASDRAGPSRDGGKAAVGRGGYARRAQYGNAADRRLTDRNQYIGFLEAQLESANEAFEMAQEAHQSAASVGSELIAVGVRVDDAELKLRSTNRSLESLQEELHDKLRDVTRTLELVQEAGSQAEAASRAQREDLEERLSALEEQLRRSDASAESRDERLTRDIAESKSGSSAELARLRNEVTLSLQELSQRVDERAAAIEESASRTAGDAQITCARLADDALAAAEGAQRRLEDLTRRAESNFEVLRVDLTGLRAEVAGALVDRNAGALQGPPGSGTLRLDELAREGDGSWNSVVENMERRLQARIGQQVMQLSEVLRRVVQAQVALHNQFGVRPLAPSSLAPMPVEPLRQSFALAPEPARAPEAGDAQRRAGSIDDLYKELRKLESCQSRGARASRPRLAA